MRAAQTTCARRATTRRESEQDRATLRAAPALAARRAGVQNHTAFHSKNGASRQMLLLAAPEAEHEEIVAV
ncbi:hypothetical protein A2U01_0076089 [Trifolium medium]|uniref:Uncharacterized protein n=1 Tax=Trifolium medium TaxID=97028 RepID=A0A392T1F5_9FABA|nr:hypothetical protein [Trifolium medium]